jgi:hypothetical protein
MGFNKRFIDTETILRLYKQQGLSKLRSFIENTDCLIMEDDLAEKVSDIILNDDLDINQKISELLDEY